MADSSARFTKLNAFVDRGQSQLRRAGCGSAAALWLTLWRFENADTDSARVGLNTLAECFGTDKRNVARMLAQLEEHGYLNTLEPGKPGRGATAVYRLLVPIEKVSPAHLSDAEKGVTNTPILAEKKGVTVTPIHEEKVSPEHEKGVTVTPVQKQKNTYGPSGSRRDGKRRAKPTNPNHPLAVAAFCEMWNGKYGTKYPFNRGKDAKAVQFVLGIAKNDLSQFKRIIANYFEDTSSFIVENRHDLGTLRLKLPRWLVPTASAAPDRRAEQRKELLSLVRKEVITLEEAEREYGDSLHERATA